MSVTQDELEFSCERTDLVSAALHSDRFDELGGCRCGLTHKRLGASTMMTSQMVAAAAPAPAYVAPAPHELSAPSSADQPHGSTGAGSGAQRAIGTGVIGGMLTGTFLGLFFIPLFGSQAAPPRRYEAKVVDAEILSPQEGKPSPPKMDGKRSHPAGR